MSVVLIYLLACLSIILMVVLVAALVQVRRFGADAFESCRVLSFANRAKDIVGPFVVAGFTLWFVSFHGLGSARIWIIAAIGCGWLLLMWSRVGFALVLFQVCLLGRASLGVGDMSTGNRASGGWNFRPAPNTRRDR